MKTSTRIRKEYGSEKAAIQHCISLNLSLTESADQLQCSRDFLRVRETLYGLKIRRKAHSERRPGERTLPPRCKKGQVIAYLSRHGVAVSNPEVIYLVEVYVGMRTA